MASIPKSAWAVHGNPIIERLTEMFNVGVSTSRIATTLCVEFKCDVTRNAVIGKANRLGLTSPNGAGFEDYNKKRKAGEAQRRHTRVPLLKKTIPLPPPAETLTPANPRHVSLIDLQHGECKFPYGDGPFTFCGCEAYQGLPYCAPHVVLCAKPKHGGEGQVHEQFASVMRRRHLPKVIAIETAAEEAA